MFRRTTFTFTTFAFAFIIALSPAAGVFAAEEKAYEIKLHRPDHKGAKFDVTIAGAVRQQTRYKLGDESRPPADQLFGVELKGVVHILEVDEKGNATRAEYTIERCVKVVDNVDEVIVEKGGVIVAEAGERDTTFTLKDGELSQEQKSAIDVVASLPRTNAPTAEQFFGTDEKQRVGDSWPVNVDALADDAKSFGMVFDREKTAGTVKLEGVETRDGIEFLRLSADTKVGAYTMEVPKDWNLPPGMTFKSGTIQMEFKGLLPVDPDLTHADVSNTYTRTMLFEGKVRRQTATMEMKTTQMVQLHAVPIKE